MLTVFSSCKNETVEPASDDHYHYFPLTTGFWSEYSADSIVHLDLDDIYEVDTAIETYHFQIREEVDTPFVDAENETAYVIKRFRRDADTLPWQFMNVWTAKVDANSAQRVEDNIRFIRMQFPIKASAMWNGNAYNFYPEEDYTYEDLFEQRSFNGLQFNSTVTVIQNDFISNINKVNKNEIYAKDAGLVFKQIDSIRTKNTPVGTIILNGLQYRQTITNYKR
jgi:hypothetical protein